MTEDERKQLWLWHVGPRVNLSPRAPDRQTIDMNGMEVDYLRRNKRHYELTFYTIDGAVTLVCREANGYHRELKCEWFPKQASNLQIDDIQAHMDAI